MNKKRLVYLAVFAILIIFCGWQLRANNLEVGKEQAVISGQVTKSVYYSDLPGQSQPTYKIDVILKNIGTGPIVFDSCFSLFHPNKNEFSLALVPPAYWISALPKELAPNQEVTYPFDTNGSTFDLIQAAAGSAIVFRIVFLKKGEIVYGPYKADLPLWHQLDFNQPQNLEFKVVSSPKKQI